MSCRVIKQQEMGRTLYVESVREVRNDGKMQLENLAILPTLGLNY